MAILTVQDVIGIAGRGRPWTIRVSKGQDFVYATGRATTELVEVVGGLFGQQPHTTNLTTFQKAIDEIGGLIGQGWQLTQTPYIRMSDKSLYAIQKSAAIAPATTIAGLKAKLSSVAGAAVSFILVDTLGNEVGQLMDYDDGRQYAIDHKLDILFGVP